MPAAACPFAWGCFRVFGGALLRTGIRPIKIDRLKNIANAPLLRQTAILCFVKFRMRAASAGDPLSLRSVALVNFQAGQARVHDDGEPDCHGIMRGTS